MLHPGIGQPIQCTTTNAPPLSASLITMPLRARRDLRAFNYQAHERANDTSVDFRQIVFKLVQNENYSTNFTKKTSVATVKQIGDN